MNKLLYFLDLCKRIGKSFSFFYYIKSASYFLKTIFVPMNYDIVFVQHNHFNRNSEGSNPFFVPFLDLCKKHNLKYIIFEEVSISGNFSMYPRNPNAHPMDFLKVIQLGLRKIFSNKNVDYTDYIKFYEREMKVVKLITTVFFRRFKSKAYVVLAHNNVELWRSINHTANIIDYQHGMIWDGHDTTIVNSSAAKIKVYNNVISMVYGKGFKNLLIGNDTSGFYTEDNVIDIGYYHEISAKEEKRNQKVILYTLQNVDMDNNTKYYEMVRNILYANRQFLEENGYKVLIKNHPRYNRADKLVFGQSLSFVQFVDDNIPLIDILDKVSIHITSKSTTTFDVGLKGIPTIFIDMLDIRSPKDMFMCQYQYPYENFLIKEQQRLKNVLEYLEEERIYQEVSDNIYVWARSFYQDFDGSKLIKLINEGDI